MGGDGADRIVGDLETLVDVLGIWSRTDLAYSDRVNLLGGPLRISALTIDDDEDSDLIMAGAGTDWTFLGVGDKTSG